MTKPVSKEETEEFLRLAGDAPLASTDVDFCATTRGMEACATRVGGTLKQPSPDDVVTPNLGILFWPHADRKIRIDFLRTTFGQDYVDLFDTSLPITLTGAEGRFRVMNPQRCFEARVHNLVEPHYRTPHALAQLRTAIECCREWTRDVLHAHSWKEARKIVKRTACFCSDNPQARTAKSKHGIDPFDAVLRTDAKLPATYSGHYESLLARVRRRER